MKKTTRQFVSVQSRWRSKPLWIATFSFIGFVLKNHFDIELAHFDTTVEMLMIILTLAGVFNSSTDAENF